jgi:hypothetical protein
MALTRCCVSFADTEGIIHCAHVQAESLSLKVIFGGDLFPSYTDNIACSVGLYTDTIVLPDPLHRLTKLRSIMASRELFRLSVKHALNALNYRDLALADVHSPIVVIAPDYLADESYRRSLMVAGEADTLEHCSRLFGRNFASIQELRGFLQQFHSMNSMLSSITDPTRLLFDVGFADQFNRYKKDYISHVAYEALQLF